MKTDIGEILKLGETQTVEFKKSLGLWKDAFRALCGMINSEAATGTVVFGVSPDGVINGIEPGSLDSVQKTLAQRVRQRFDPPIVPRIEVCEWEDKHLVILAAHRAKGESYHEYDGRAYIREGSTTRQLTYDEKQGLHKRRDRNRHNGPWECDRCAGSVHTLAALTYTPTGVRKSYACPCGGEFWPMT